LQYKEKLTYQKMIDWFKNKGIKFEKISKQKTIKILSSEEYFFRVSSYRKNFKKVNGKYQNLDFTYLVDLSEFDRKLRYFILGMALDYESAIKVKIMDLITNDYREDGYKIVEDFQNDSQNSFEISVNQFSRNPYLAELYYKRHKDLAIWTFMEIITFGTLSRFIEFYYNRSRIKIIKNAKNLTKFAKNIRNACAHGNILIVNLFEEVNNKRNKSNQFILTIADNIGIGVINTRNPKIRDLMALFYLHKKFCSSQTCENRKIEGNKLLKEALEENYWLKQNKLLTEWFSIVIKLLDYL
jgi:abortive infection bacteriophage resistance protein